jgi:hypothetical protein
MTDLVERIREMIENHRTDPSGDVAQEIIDHLKLRRETVGNEIRYVGAWFNNELTILEGAE